MTGVEPVAAPAVADRPVRRGLRVSGRRAHTGSVAGSAPPLRGILVIIAGLGIWQLVGDKNSPYYPPPREWWRGLRVLYKNSDLMGNLGATVYVVVLALVVSTAIGAVVGAVVGRIQLLDRSVGPSLEFLRSIPAAAVVPLFVLVLGYKTEMKVSVVVFASVWPVLLAVRSAVLRIEPLRRDVAMTLHLSRTAALWKITLPSLLPAIFLGVRISAPQTLILTLLTEILTHVKGLGALMVTAQGQFLTSQVYGLVVVAGVLALVINYIVAIAELLLRRRGHFTA